MPTIPARQPYQPPLKVRACYMLSQRAHHETDLKGFPALAAVDSQPLSGGASFMPITPSEILQWCTLCRVGWCQWLTQTVCARWGGMYPERERYIYIYLYMYTYIYMYICMIHMYSKLTTLQPWSKFVAKLNAAICAVRLASFGRWSCQVSKSIARHLLMIRQDVKTIEEYWRPLESMVQCWIHFWAHM